MDSFLEDYPRGFPWCVGILIFASIIIAGFMLDSVHPYASYIGFGIAVVIAAIAILSFGYYSLQEE